MPNTFMKDNDLCNISKCKDYNCKNSFNETLEVINLKVTLYLFFWINSAPLSAM